MAIQRIIGYGFMFGLVATGYLFLIMIAFSPRVGATKTIRTSSRRRLRPKPRGKKPFKGHAKATIPIIVLCLIIAGIASWL